MNTLIHLDDIGLFKKRRPHEKYSQRERAEQIRDQFKDCMDRAYCNGCIMPGLCALGDPQLHCAHLIVDYANFTGGGIPLTGRARATFDARLRGIGTQVYRTVSGSLGPLPGDIHVASLQQIKHFTGGPRKSKAPSTNAKGAKRTPAKQSGGWLSRIFG